MQQPIELTQIETDISDIDTEIHLLIRISGGCQEDTYKILNRTIARLQRQQSMLYKKLQRERQKIKDSGIKY